MVADNFSVTCPMAVFSFFLCQALLPEVSSPSRISDTVSARSQSVNAMVSFSRRVVVVIDESSYAASLDLLISVTCLISPCVLGPGRSVYMMFWMTPVSPTCGRQRRLLSTTVTRGGRPESPSRSGLRPPRPYRPLWLLEIGSHHTWRTTRNPRPRWRSGVLRDPPCPC